MLPRFLAVFVHKLLKFTLQYFLILKKKQTTHLKMPIKFLRTSTAERNKCFIGKQLHCGTTRAIFTSLSPAVYFSFRQRPYMQEPLWKDVLCLTVTSLHISKGRKKVPVRTLQVLPQPYGQMEVGGVTLDFIYSRHSDIVIKWIHQCFSNRYTS